MSDTRQVVTYHDLIPTQRWVHDNGGNMSVGQIDGSHAAAVYDPRCDPAIPHGLIRTTRGLVFVAISDTVTYADGNFDVMHHGEPAPLAYR